MGDPVIVWLRPGVGFNQSAAMAWARAEAALGRDIRTNSTYRDYDRQLSMHIAWNAYASGHGPYPGHSMAVHPDDSEHCRGSAADTPEVWSRAFLSHMREHGWVQTAPNDPTERHHLAYRSHLDQHRNEPAPAGINFTPIEEDDMTPAQEQLLRDVLAVTKNIESILATEGPTRRGLKGAVEQVAAVTKNIERILATESNAGTTRGIKGGIEELTKLVRKLLPPA